jgi:molecular chaperone DnaK
MGKAVRIDLGTTFSITAAVQRGRSPVIPDAEGIRAAPWVVAVSQPGELPVGQKARRRANATRSNTPFLDVVPGPIGALRLDVVGRLYEPGSDSAQVLRKLGDDTGKSLGERVVEALMMMPAHFNGAQRQAIKNAGKFPGREVLRLVDVPPAAAVSYGLSEVENATVLVFDLGGGADSDRRIIDYLAVELEKSTGIELRDGSRTLQLLLAAAAMAVWPTPGPLTQAEGASAPRLWRSLIT